jgi:hypothetical protein
MFGRDKITESFGKESLGKPFKIILLVSSAHIPFRARNIARRHFLSGSHEVVALSEFPPIMITDIIVRELGFFARNTMPGDEEKRAASEFQAHLESETARAKLTYVREFHTYGAMNRIRKSKPDLIIDISNGAEVHEIVCAESRLGVLQIERVDGINYVRLITPREMLTIKQRPADGAGSLLLEGVLELLGGHKLNQ